jgi:hypothetical protein
MNVCGGRVSISMIAGAALALLSLTGYSPAADCNGNQVDDAADIAAGTSADCNVDGRPDECDLRDGSIAFDEARVVLAEGRFYMYPARPVHADLDGDGDIDIVVAGDAVGVIFNRGDGVFGLPVTVAPELERSGGVWNSIRGGDLDGDGDIDLALTSQHRPEIAFLANDGNGGFAVGHVVPLPGEAKGRPHLTDLEGDGDLDLVELTISYRDGLRIYDTVALLENRGNATFDVDLIASAHHGGAPIPVDLDGDSFPDLVSSYREQDESGNYIEGGVAVRHNAGDGTFLEFSLTPLGAPLSGFILEDLDGDADPDLAGAFPASEAVTVLRNTGDGAFAPRRDTPAGGPAEGLLAVDLDADGDADLLASGDGDFQGDSFGTSVLANDGSGSFRAPQILSNLHRVGAADFDGDGLPDLIAWGYLDRAPLIEVRRNLGGLSFEEQARLSMTDEVQDVFPMDLDRDGDLDLVKTNPVEILRNVTGSESFSLGCAGFVRGDANADGGVSIADIVTITRFQHLLLCRDAGDANDDEVADLCDASFITRTLFLGDTGISAPYPAPASDPTSTPVQSSVSGLGCGETSPGARAGCAEYAVEEPIEVGDVVRIGDAFALPGGEVSIPILVSTSVPVEGIQLVLEYDPDVLDFGNPEPFRSFRSLDFEGSFYGQFPPDAGGWDAPNLSPFHADPERGLIMLGIVGSFWHDGFDVPPGEEILVASMRAAVSADVEPGTLISIGPAAGTEEGGVGPHRLRNELVHRGDARFVSVLPEIRTGYLQIVGDQSYFVRGDSNGDWTVDISDPVSTLNTLFLGAAGTACPDAADSNDDGKADISDAIHTLGFLYIGEAPMPPPYPEAGTDPTADELRCLRLPR